MTYVFLDEINQTITYPPQNKDNICNYNLAIDLLKADGYLEVDDSLIALFNGGKAKVQSHQIIDISETDEYKAKIAEKEKTIKKVELQSQIDELEKSQARPIRELRKDPENVYANNKMDSIDARIQDLRLQIVALN